MTKQIISNSGWVVTTLLLGFFVLTSVSSPFTKTSEAADNYLNENAKLTDFNDFDFEKETFENVVDRPDMADPCLGGLTIFAGNFAPRGWAFCDGQLLPINQNQSLYSLLGTMYGGDGRTSFGLPDLRGRAAVHMGSNAGRTFNEGAKGGAETSQINLTASSVASAPLGSTGNVSNISYISLTPATGNVNNMQPFQTVNYIIALQGVFCSRD